MTTTRTLSGGDKLQAKLAEISKRLEGQHSLKVGFLEGSRYPDENGQGDITAAQSAFWLNYGTKTAPPRPFFSNLIAEKGDTWGDELMKIMVANDWNIDVALAQMGERIAGQLRDAIVNMDSPALSPVTLMLRKMLIDDPDLIITGATVGEAAARVAAGESPSPASTKVGVRSGHMLASVDYEVGE